MSDDLCDTDDLGFFDAVINQNDVADVPSFDNINGLIIMNAVPGSNLITYKITNRKAGRFGLGEEGLGHGSMMVGIGVVGKDTVGYFLAV